jgi:hypothetical protein
MVLFALLKHLYWNLCENVHLCLVGKQTCHQLLHIMICECSVRDVAAFACVFFFPQIVKYMCSVDYVYVLVLSIR